MLHRIELSYAVFGIETRGDVVMKAAPIARWMRGKTLERVEKWVRDRGGSIQPVPSNGS